ncbi:MAG: ArsI/CadI family heavy metal resistance metalloenzyme [Ekhidna sp.]|uniref:ArsI/CadI family heavy metal resistance metalloenzyme n=1 Tax=Ekhidna sp. TaxID=2608089 RepID=UPI0032ED1B2C
MEQFKFHVGLNVSDIEQTTIFYEKLFGQKPVKVEKGYSKFELENPGLVISFIESREAQPRFGHMGIRVNSQEELVAKKGELEALMKIELEEKNTSCCYAVQDKFWVRDPDGYEWEVYHFLKDDDKMGGRQSVGESKKELAGCC